MGSLLYPKPSKELLISFTGQDLENLPTPSAIIDVAIARRNCQHMLSLCEYLNVGFRAHVKTHKTGELARMQVGHKGPAKFVVSTLLEAEHLVPLFKDLQAEGREVNVLYGIPLPPSQIPRLGKIVESLGEGAVTVMVDNIAQIEAVERHTRHLPHALHVFVKVDTGYHRSGVQAGTENSKAFGPLIGALQKFQSSGEIIVEGFYSHGGHSYHGSSVIEAKDILADEIRWLRYAAQVATALGLKPQGRQKKFTLSVGATPSVSSARVWAAGAVKSETDAESKDQSEGIRLDVNADEISTLEFHAGVYPLLDMQQLSTGTALKEDGGRKGYADMALTVLAEVNSIYEDRDEMQALITAGCLALGREPCHSYDGWGEVSAWGIKQPHADGRSGWFVKEVSQEHGKLMAFDRGDHGSDMPFGVGQKVRVWPNHACIASAGYPVYFVVDSEDETKGEKVVDVWVRCRGW